MSLLKNISLSAALVKHVLHFSPDVCKSFKMKLGPVSGSFIGWSWDDGLCPLARFSKICSKCLDICFFEWIQSITLYYLFRFWIVFIFQGGLSLIFFLWSCHSICRHLILLLCITCSGSGIKLCSPSRSPEMFHIIFRENKPVWTGWEIHLYFN